MPTDNVTQSRFQTAADTPGTVVPIADALILTANAAIFATGPGLASPGIRALGANVLTIHGDVFSGASRGIFGATGGNTISISATGSVFGRVDGIYLTAGNNTISNAGDIHTLLGNAVVVEGGVSNVITNSGTMRSGNGRGLSTSFSADTTLNNSGLIEGTASFNGMVFGGGSIVNTGTIIGGVGGIGFKGLAASSVINSGTIASLTDYGIFGSGAVETIVNNGLIQSATGIATVAFLGGNDVYDGRGGRVIGAVLGEGGTDTLWGGAFVDRLEGGADNDQINGGGLGDYIDGGTGYDFARYDFATTGVQARLDDPALNTGEAVGDTMYNFEGLVGSQHGDILIGNNLAMGNQIYGLGGNDTIRGLGGADTLFGGAGADSIFTGDGTDTVWVQAADLIATQLDRVYDFTDGQDHLRFQGISAASATITDSQGGTLIQFNVAGGQYSVFLDGITKAASADQIFFV